MSQFCHQFAKRQQRQSSRCKRHYSTFDDFSATELVKGLSIDARALAKEPLPINPPGITMDFPATCASQHGNVVSRENGHAVLGALPLPDCFVPESPKGIHGKGFLLCLELLETNHVRLRLR